MEALLRSRVITLLVLVGYFMISVVVTAHRRCLPSLLYLTPFVANHTFVFGVRTPLGREARLRNALQCVRILLKRKRRLLPAYIGAYAAEAIILLLARE